MGLQKNTHDVEMTAMRCSLELDALFFVKHLQDGVTKEHA
jgi:hypothetical protein